MVNANVIWAGCAASLCIAGVSLIAERRRANRAELDAVGFMPWTFILIMSMIAAAVFAAVGLKV
jgi:hypothetical protein